MATLFATVADYIDRSQLAQPLVGEAYRQEYYEDEAEDLREVLCLNRLSRVATAGSS